MKDIKRDWYFFTNGSYLVYPPIVEGENERVKSYCKKYGVKIYKVIFSKTEKELHAMEY